MIITNDEDALRVHCEDVESLEEAKEIIIQLESELKESARLGRSGIGLAAPQIGIAKKVAIVRLNEIKINLINCKIGQGFDQAIFKNEGCLSFPGKYEDTLRYQEVVVSNNLIYPHSFIATGLTAVVCQHEIGHWNSDLFIDHLNPKQTPIVIKSKTRPNEPCFCGSKIKYKKCCGK
jgi:peptide deformylase